MSVDGDYTRGEIEEFLSRLPFMPGNGNPLPDYVYREFKPEFISAIMAPPVTDYGGVLQDKVALDMALFLKGGSFEITKRLEETGWSSDSLGYDAEIAHKPTGTKWSIEVWTAFDWGDPSKYSDGYLYFIHSGKLIAEDRWEFMPGEDWEEDSFGLTSKGGEEASKVITEHGGAS